MPDHPPEAAFRRTAAYSAIMGVALGNIIAAIMIPQAIRNAIA